MNYKKAKDIQNKAKSLYNKLLDKNYDNILNMIDKKIQDRSELGYDQYTIDDFDINIFLKTNTIFKPSGEFKLKIVSHYKEQGFSVNRLSWKIEISWV